MFKVPDMSEYVFSPPAIQAIPIVGSDKLFPVNRIFCVGRNYEAHAKEMGVEIDREAPFYFTKSTASISMAEGSISYAKRTQNYHYEMEMVLAIGAAGLNVDIADAESLIFGCAAGLDMTRRDLQNDAKKLGRPWDTSKDVEQSAVITPIKPIAEVPSIATARIHLAQNGEIKQESDLALMVWSAAEIIADLSSLYHLQPGDLIYTGTPAGVGPVERGDTLVGGVDGIADFTVSFT